MDAPHTYDELWVANLLSKSVGDDAALAIVREVAAELGIDDSELEEGQVLAILEAIAARPGLVGVSARFCRSRLIAQFSREDLERRR